MFWAEAWGIIGTRTVEGGLSATTSTSFISVSSSADKHQSNTRKTSATKRLGSLFRRLHVLPDCRKFPPPSQFCPSDTSRIASS
ncbi:hypothetical protein AOLI_G00073790 [Acnodon oligacanthus]